MAQRRAVQGGGVDDLVAHARTAGDGCAETLILLMANFESGCPVLAVAVEPLTDADESADRLRELASAAFMRWQSVLVEALHREGVPTERAQRLGVLVVASIEGTVAMCRASRSLGPLDDVYRELEYLLENVIRPT